MSDEEGHGWTHPQCERCWLGQNTKVVNDHDLSVRLPVRMKDPEVEYCCWCGALTIFGVYVRQDPQGLVCDSG
jgi:hypothetical protein